MGRNGGLAVGRVLPRKITDSSLVSLPSLCIEHTGLHHSQSLITGKIRYTVLQSHCTHIRSSCTYTSLSTIQYHLIMPTRTFTVRCPHVFAHDLMPRRIRCSVLDYVWRAQLWRSASPDVAQAVASAIATTPPSTTTIPRSH